MYPALAVAEALPQLVNNIALEFVGTQGGFERPLVERSGLTFNAYHEIMGGPIAGVNPLRAALSTAKLSFGVLQSLTLLLRRRPAAVLMTGGWANLPLAVATWLVRVPAVVYLPDIEPGMTIRFLARFVPRVAITMPESAAYFREGQTVVTGYPLRQDRLNATREEAIKHFQLDPQRLTLLVTGGSRGARSINIAVINIARHLLDEDVQILHISGTLDYQRCQQQAGDLLQHPHYHLYPYLYDDMGLAYAAADVVVARAGASVLGEIPHFAVPSILIPYPYAWRYQKVNADYLEKRGAAIHLADEEMAEGLLPLLQDLFRNPQRRQQIIESARAVAQPNGAARIAQLLIDVARR